MSRIITFSMELTDEEFSFFLNNRVAPALGNSNVAPVGGAGNESDEGQVNTNAPAVDKNGIPWLADVHAGTKAMNQDGTWRAKRGVDKAVVAAAEAAAKTQTGTNLSTGGERVDQNAVQTAALAPAPGLPPMPGLPPVLPPPAAAEPPKPVSYEELSGLVQSVLTAGHQPDAITAIYAEVGLTDVNDLLTNETLRANLAGKLRAKFNIA